MGLSDAHQPPARPCADDPTLHAVAADGLGRDPFAESSDMLSAHAATAAIWRPPRWEGGSDPRPVATGAHTGVMSSERVL